MGEAKRRKAAGFAQAVPTLPQPLRFLAAQERALPPGFFDTADRLHREGRGLRPTWAFLTQKETAEAFSEAVKNREGQAQDSLSLAFEALSHVQDCHFVRRLVFATTFRASKAVFRFEPALAARLRRSPAETPLDPEAFWRLPHSGLWVEAPNGEDGDRFAFGAALTPSFDEDETLVELVRLVETPRGPKCEGGTLRLDGSTAAEAVDRFLAEASVWPGGFDGLRADDFRAFALQAVGMLLHLCGPEPVASAKTGHARPRSGHEGVAGPSGEWVVSVRDAGVFGAIRDGSAEWKGGTHARPRPHVRRSHFRTIWTGPDRDVPRLVRVGECLVATSTPNSVPAVVRTLGEGGGVAA